jgi:hypothetical protein
MSSIDKGHPQFDCARVRRPITYAGRYGKRDPLLTEVFKVNRRFERGELLNMFTPKTLQTLINGGFLELFPK